MKKVHNYIHTLPKLFCIAAAFIILLQSCDKEEMSPVVTEVRNYAASPNDTLIETLNTGQWVVLLGKNLSGVTEVYFGSTPANINRTYFTDQSIVVQVPSIPFQSVSREKLNEITVVSKGGSAIFTINIIGEPIITHVRNYDASPNDTIVNSLVPGQQINIIGYNLKNAIEISFQGKVADLTNAIYTDSSAIVQVPTDLSGSDASLANTISYTNAVGTGTFQIKIFGPPIILRVSYENPNEGDSVYLYGNNFSSALSLTFAGATVSSFSVAADGNTIGFVAPAMTQSGPVEITTPGGSFTTVYNVHDIVTGIISDFEWGPNFHWDWWAGAELKSNDSNFPGNSGQYLVLKTNILDSDGGSETSTAIRIGGQQWVPVANLSDPTTSWALKFEVSIPDNWNGGTLSIKSSNDSYRARYEPWQISASKTVPYSTNGWITVVIPLNSFRASDPLLGQGKGAPVATITDLIGGTGASDLILYMHNYGTAPTATGFNAAFDNFRVVKR